MARPWRGECLTRALRAGRMEEQRREPLIGRVQREGADEEGRDDAEESRTPPQHAGQGIAHDDRTGSGGTAGPDCPNRHESRLRT